MRRLAGAFPIDRLEAANAAATSRNRVLFKTWTKQARRLPYAVGPNSLKYMYSSADASGAAGNT